MKFGRLLSIDYKAYYTLVLIMVCAVAVIMFSIFLALGMESERNPTGAIMGMDILFAGALCWFGYRLSRRYTLVNRVLARGISATGTVTDAVTVRADQLRCHLDFTGRKTSLDLRLTKRNRDAVLGACTAGNMVEIMYLPGGHKDVIIPELYR